MADTIPDVAGLLPHRACRNCMQIKVKCIPRTEENGHVHAVCRRCHRLGKECTTPAPVVRKRRKPGSSRVAQLEERINHLTNLLTPHSSPETTPTSALAASIKQNQSGLTQDRQYASLAATQTVIPDQQTPMLDQTQPRAESPIFACRIDALVPSLPVSAPGVDGRDERLSSVIAPPHLVAQAGGMGTKPAKFCPMVMDSQLEHTLFERFRRDMSPSFPFVVVAPSATPATTKKEKPFLFWAACAVASYSKRSLHFRLTDQLLKCIAEQVFSKAHKSLDLLQGILILLSWYHYYSHMNPQMVNLLYLAQAVATDLGFNRSSSLRTRRSLMTDLADVYHGCQVVHGIQTSDDRRALLGVFVFSSRLALCFERVDPMKFSHHMDLCCRDLGAAAEYASDLHLVHVTRLHQIAGRFLGFDGVDTKLPPRFLMSTLNDELQKFQQQLPPPLANHVELLMEIDCCRFCLLGPTHIGNCDDQVEAVEPLYASLVSMMEFTDRLLGLRPKEFMNIPAWLNISYVIGALAELAFLNTESWDRDFVRERYGLKVVMGRYVDMLEACQQYAKDNSCDDLAKRYRMYNDKLRKCIKWYELKISLESRTNTTADLLGGMNFPENFPANFFDQLNDPLWENIVEDWAEL